MKVNKLLKHFSNLTLINFKFFFQHPTHILSSFHSALHHLTNPNKIYIFTIPSTCSQQSICLFLFSRGPFNFKISSAICFATRVCWHEELMKIYKITFYNYSTIVRGTMAIEMMMWICK